MTVGMRKMTINTVIIFIFITVITIFASAILTGSSYEVQNQHFHFVITGVTNA